MSEINTIEDILDNAIDQMMNGVDIQDILNDYPEYADELRPLLARAAILQNAPQPNASSSTEGLMKIISILAENETQGKKRIIKFTPKRIFLKVAASIAIIFCIGWGSVYASSDTIPGDWFYSVKLFTEKVRFFLSVNHENKVELRITYSTERLKELVKKYNSGAGLDKELLKQMLDEAKAALDDSQNLQNHKQPLMSDRITSLTHLQINTLKKIETNATPKDKKILRNSINRCSEMMQCCAKMNKGKMGKQNNMMQCPMMNK